MHVFSRTVEYLLLENGEANAHSQEFLFLRGIHNEFVDKGVGFFMFISNFTTAVIYLCSYYLVDLQSRIWQDSMIPQGKSVLLKFAGLQDIEKYAQVVYLQERKLNLAYFQIEYVHRNISDKNISHVLNTFQDPGEPKDNKSIQ